MSSQSRNIRLTVAILVIAIGLIVSGFVYRILQPSYLSPLQLQNNGAYLLPKPRIINDFDLVDQDGEAFTVERLKGKWTMVFFGFTRCPDVCPATLAILRQFKQLMQGSAELDDLQIVFVSVDPARDTPELIKPYLNYFDPEFIGLSGEFMALQAFALNLNAAFQKVPGGGDSYQIDHSANVVLINPFGHYHAFYRPQLEPAKLKMTYRSIHSTFEREYQQ